MRDCIVSGRPARTRPGAVAIIPVTARLLRTAVFAPAADKVALHAGINALRQPRGELKPVGTPALRCKLQKRPALRSRSGKLGG